MHKLALLLPLALLSSCAMPGIPGMPSRGGSGHISSSGDIVMPMRLRADAPHISGSINGSRALPILVDTGASVCVFESNIAAGTGIAATGHSASLRGVHGNAAARSGVIRALDFGPWHLDNVPCYVRHSATPRIGGLGSAILGIDQLRRHASYVTFDYRRGTIELGRGHSYTTLGGNTTRVPFRMSGGLPVIRVGSGGLTWDAVIDTGSSWGIVINQATAARLGHAGGGRGMGAGLVLSGVGGNVSADRAGARIIRVPNASLCGQTYYNPEVYVMPGPMRIGSRFWQNYRMTLDFRTSTLWLER